jgi:hypothetical protein
MVFLCGILGYFGGEFIIGGILYAMFGKGDANSSQNKAYGWIGKIVGVLLAVYLFKNL